MNAVTIYGSSDDLIECESDTSLLQEEFNQDSGFLFFDDGTIVKVEYTKGGIWRVIKLEGPSAIALFTPNSERGPEDYSDILVLKGAFTTVDCFTSNPPDSDDFSERLNDFTPSDYSCDQLKRIYAITKESR